MIRHIVTLSLRPEHDADELANVMQELSALTMFLSGFHSFHHGPNRDYEGKSGDYAYGFVCAFTNPDALQLYANDPRHHALGARLVAMCQGGGDGIMVVDLETAP